LISREKLSIALPAGNEQRELRGKFRWASSLLYGLRMKMAEEV